MNHPALPTDLQPPYSWHLKLSNKREAQKPYKDICCELQTSLLLITKTHVNTITKHNHLICPRKPELSTNWWSCSATLVTLMAYSRSLRPQQAFVLLIMKDLLAWWLLRTCEMDIKEMSCWSGLDWRVFSAAQSIIPRSAQSSIHLSMLTVTVCQAITLQVTTCVQIDMRDLIKSKDKKNTSLVLSHVFCLMWTDISPTDHHHYHVKMKIATPV